jgi:hypothetical protein
VHRAGSDGTDEPRQLVIPVTFAPGRARLAMSPSLTGSKSPAITMGIIAVAAMPA